LVCYAQSNHYADPEMMSFNQIGQALGFSGVTARNVFESAMRKLRDALDAAE
jgi:hypothetical protein